MSTLDWVVLGITIAIIVAVGLRHMRGASTADAFLRGSQRAHWSTVGLGVMATQASAITFLSVPGQAHEDGMRFVQFYLGMPLAMIVISAVFVPRYFGLNVYTAYEFLESRFDLKTRLLGAALFLVQRGLASGITLYAPAIILSAVLGWPLEPTVVAMGGLVILYTVLGGQQAVGATQKQQMVVMMGGMVVAAVVTVMRLPEGVGLDDAAAVAGAMGRMNAITFTPRLDDRYNAWSGLLGGFFLALSYFGTDQSQVGRYLSGRSITQARLGLLFNGVLKIPMQALILFVGVLVFVFHQFTAPPILFNDSLRARVAATSAEPDLLVLERAWQDVQERKRGDVEAFLRARDAGDAEAQAAARAAMKARQDEANALRKQAQDTVKRALPGAETRDADYIFIGFVKRWLPPGLFGLLVAVILSAAMSSIAGELSALGATTTVDFYRRLWRRDATDAQVLWASRAFTVLWGLVAVAFAGLASLLDNLIQAVNIMGSIFYGTVLGLFLVAFFLKRVGGHAVFAAALVAQGSVVALFLLTDLGYLWFNVVGCALVCALALVLQPWMGARAQAVQK